MQHIFIILDVYLKFISMIQKNKLYLKSVELWLGVAWVGGSRKSMKMKFFRWQSN